MLYVWNIILRAMTLHSNALNPFYSPHFLITPPDSVTHLGQHSGQIIELLPHDTRDPGLILLSGAACVEFAVLRS